MADFAAPPGPPPPKVPEGWVARWNDQYKEWFYVNTYTKVSQWEKPTEPAIPPRDDLAGAPGGPPPSYNPGASAPVVSDAKVNPYDNLPNQTGSSSKISTEEEDARLARQLQAEEDARARASPSGAAASYGQNQQGPQDRNNFPGYLPPRPDNLEKGKSFLGKLFGNKKSSHGGGLTSGFPGGLMGSHGGGHHSPQPWGGHHSPAPGYGGPAPSPMGGYGGHGSPQPGYGGYPPQQGYYGGQPGYGQPYGAHNKPGKSGSGMGMMAGGAALGVGAGLLGGALVADAIYDNQQEAYQEGYQDGAGGDDFGGGDFGGDF